MPATMIFRTRLGTEASAALSVALPVAPVVLVVGYKTTAQRFFASAFLRCMLQRGSGSCLCPAALVPSGASSRVAPLFRDQRLRLGGQCSGCPRTACCSQTRPRWVRVAAVAADGRLCRAADSLQGPVPPPRWSVFLSQRLHAAAAEGRIRLGLKRLGRSGAWDAPSFSGTSPVGGVWSSGLNVRSACTRPGCQCHRCGQRIRVRPPLLSPRIARACARRFRRF